MPYGFLQETYISLKALSYVQHIFIHSFIIKYVYLCLFEMWAPLIGWYWALHSEVEVKHDASVVC